MDPYPTSTAAVMVMILCEASKKRDNRSILDHCLQNDLFGWSDEGEQLNMFFTNQEEKEKMKRWIGGDFRGSAMAELLTCEAIK
jgi:hypothetical protein